MELFNAEAERAVLGGLMMWQKEIEEVDLLPEDFYEVRHEQLFDLMLKLSRQGLPIETISLSSRVGHIQGVDAGYLHSLYSSAPMSSVLIKNHAAVMRTFSQKRSLMAFAGRLTDDMRETAPEDLPGVLDALRADLDGIANRNSGVQVKTFSQQLAESIETWLQPADKNFKPTGWEELDDILNGGWKPGQVTVLGARPAVGKSAVAACATVAAHNYGVGFFSLEMSDIELIGRMVAIEKSIKLDRITRHDLTEEDWSRIADMQSEAEEWKLWLESRPRRSISQIRATLRTWNRRGHLPLVVIDYLQLLAPADSRESRERQVSRMAEDCKALAKDFNCHVLLLAQVNRGSANREDKRPVESDLRESGGIEANADNIILLHRDEEREDIIEFNVVKNRHGRKGRLELAWRPDFSSANTQGQTPRSYAFGLPKRKGI